MSRVAAVSAGARRLGAELKANPRLRWGAWLVAGILWFYGVLVLRDEANAGAVSLQQASRQQARARALLSEPEWTPRLEQARSQQLALEQRLWRESTVGLAQAAFQDWLTIALQQAGAAKPQVNVAAQEAAAGEARALADTWKVTGRVSFEFDPNALHALLARIASHEKLVVVESLMARNAPGGRVELMLVAHFVKAGPVAAAPATKAGS